MSVTFGPLGRLVPKHYDHVEEKPLSGLELALWPKFFPVTFGINWYSAFDRPVLKSDGRYYLPENRLGYIRGGHAITAEPAVDPSMGDLDAWWRFYNQLSEGACEGFSHSRALSIVKRKTYDAFWVYDDARRVENTYPYGEGSSNGATCTALERWGAHPEEGQECKREPWTAHSRVASQEISAFRWITTAQQVWEVLGVPSTQPIAWLNSWGEGYPHRVYLGPTLVERLLREGGECDVMTEK